MTATRATNGASKSRGDGAGGGRRGSAAGGGTKPARSRSPSKEKTRATSTARAEAAASYDARKEFEGRRYTGVKVGRGHKWRYDAGEWVEKKLTPDKWEFRFDVIKRRVGRAPEGSGVPPGTEYHWYILAHQTATKLDANDYETRMFGLKYKLAHKRADKSAWSASERAQARRLIAVLRELIAELEQEPPKPATAKATKNTKEPSDGATARRRGEGASSRGPRAPARAPRRAEASRGASASA